MVSQRHFSKSVFVLAIFELDVSVKKLPETKQDLVALLEKDKAVPFHYRVCPDCHAVPGAEEWKLETGHGEVNVQRINKFDSIFGVKHQLLLKKSIKRIFWNALTKIL